MVAIQNILCPIDLSEPARRALQHAAALGRWYGARVRVLHVVPALQPRTPDITPAYPGPYPGLAVLDPAVRQPLVEELEAAAASSRGAGLDLAVEIEEGETVSVILAEAERHGADLVVVGTHGARHGVGRLLLGSVAEKVLHRSKVPVLAVPPRALDAEPSEAPVYQRILCAVDFSETALRAVDCAVSLARETGAELTLLHVHEDEPAGELVAPGEASRSADEERRVLETHLRGRMPPAGELRAKAEVVNGAKPGEAILEQAHMRGCDLLVIGARGRRTVGAAVFGSTTDRVVRGASCPVLTVRRADD
jgi:nucleotide-binding universal stress UspA family protein